MHTQLNLDSHPVPLVFGIGKVDCWCICLPKMDHVFVTAPLLGLLAVLAVFISTSLYFHYYTQTLTEVVAK